MIAVSDATLISLTILTLLIFLGVGKEVGIWGKQDGKERDTDESGRRL